MQLADHLVIAPIVLPLLSGAFMLLLDGRSRNLVAAVNLVSTVALLIVALRLFAAGALDSGAPAISVYLLGNWSSLFGIVLVADRLATMLLLLTAVLALAALLFSLARWHSAGSYFHPLFQFLLMGLNGAFLTGDLFNLFVFFEVLLAASYGLALHGSGNARVKAGLHYIAVNLTASSVFLIGVSLMYGTAGTLNMADLAARIPHLAERERVLFEVGAAILGIVFLVKSAMWPLGFWLPTTYGAAAPPVAALFAVMTKVGVYAVLRLGLLFAEPESGGSVLFGEGWLLAGGVMTVLFGTLGLLAAQGMSRLAGYNVLISSGTLLAVLGVGDVDVTSGALFYLVSSTLAVAAFFLLIELVERGRTPADDILAVTLEAYGVEDEEETRHRDAVGVAVPAILAILGVGFIACALLLAGMPPLSSFVAKFAMLTALLDPTRPGNIGSVSDAAWILVAMLILSGLATLIAMTRAGIRAFWSSIERELPTVRVVELAPVAALLLLCVLLTAQAGPVMRYMQATAEGLHSPSAYIGSVLNAPTATGGGAWWR